MSPNARETRDHRWDLRVAESEDALVRAASDTASTSYTGFIRSAAIAEAHRVLADRDSFELEKPDWEKFTELLNRPARVPDGLRDLFAKPSVFE